MDFMSSQQSSMKFYSVTEAAGLIGLSSMSLYRAIRAGTFPAVRIRGRVFVPARALEAIVEAAVESGSLIDTGHGLTDQVSTADHVHGRLGDHDEVTAPHARHNVNGGPHRRFRWQTQ
jgi:excisionase family DNA binding protein